MTSAGISAQNNNFNFTPELHCLFQQQQLLGLPLLCDDKSSTSTAIDQQLTLRQQQPSVISVEAKKSAVSTESIISATTNDVTSIRLVNAVTSTASSQAEAGEIPSRSVILAVAGGNQLINSAGNSIYSGEFGGRSNAIALTAATQPHTVLENANFACIFGDVPTAFQTPPNYFSSLAAAVSGLGAFQQTFQQTQLQTQAQQQQQLPSLSADDGTERRRCSLKRKRFHQSIHNAADEDENPAEVKPKKIISPFAPEATVPLPFQLSEFAGLGTTVWKRNERERYRVRCVNEGYERLRSSLPVPDHERRLSKVDTLRLAIYYIQHLQYLLYDAAHAARCNCFANFTAENDASAVALAGAAARGGGSSSAGSGIDC